MTDEETCRNNVYAIAEEFKTAMIQFVGYKRQKPACEKIRRELVFNYRNNGIMCGKVGATREKSKKGWFNRQTAFYSPPMR